MTVTIRHGDCREVLQTMPDQSVHCCVTSPPYFGLRDYGVAGQIGLDLTPELFVEQMVAVFREVRRVLRDDGTLWLNLGDSYAASGRGGNPDDSPHQKQASNRGSRQFFQEHLVDAGAIGRQWVKPPPGYKQKDLIGIPWMVAFALRADGWYLRRDIIWHKLNPMPESVRDRPSTAHEYVFLLSKSRTYYYDAEAILEPVSANTHARLSQDVESQIGSERANGGRKTNGRMKAVGRNSRANVDRVPRSRKVAPSGSGIKNNDSFDAAMAIMPTMRNKRSVWPLATEAFSEAHFATFPPALVEPCVLAGCPAGGTVIDPFGGAGTTGMVADRLQRDAILIELNPEYAAIADRRIRGDAGMFADVGTVSDTSHVPNTQGE
jgi:DNA modification methylase